MRVALAAALLLTACGGVAPASTDASGSTGTASSTSTGAPIDCAGGPDELFIKRIAPLLATDRPKTCNTCHLSGVDMEMFVQDTPCQTMACLESKGLVDLSAPEASVVLGWISRADPASPLIDQEVIDEEYQAFLAWIEATAQCGLCWSGDSPCGEPSGEECEEDEEAPAWVDPGDCSPLTRESLFRHKVYAWRDRCFPCHFDSSDIEAPKWIATGSCELGSLMTMRNVLERGLVNYDEPEQSLLLLKPLAESAGGVMHGGHDKFADKTDEAYVDFLAWISREAECAP
ncbi:hypothetical protein [Nannocystis pusilla]|uniref:hypothetical protein n=1 Tax=Nannocystis pusilla TaxID=889268 RepID=UPI003DA640F0